VSTASGRVPHPQNSPAVQPTTNEKTEAKANPDTLAASGVDEAGGPEREEGEGITPWGEDSLFPFLTAKKEDWVHMSPASPDATWADFLEYLDLDNPGTKKASNFFAGVLSDTVKKKGCKRKDCANHRCNDVTVSKSAVVLDGDKGALDFLAELVLVDTAYIVHDTYNSKADARRQRLIIPTSRPVLPHEYKPLVVVTASRFGGYEFDPASKTLSQIMYRPATKEGGVYEWHEGKGRPLDVDYWLARAEDEPSLVEPRECTCQERAADGRHPYTAAAVAGEVARLKALEEQGYDGPGWDTTCYAVACNLIELSMCKASGLSVGSAMDAYLAHAPVPDEDGWDDDRIRSKWASALGKSTLSSRCVGSGSDVGVAPSGEAPEVALKACHEVFSRWLSDRYDLASLNATLAARAVADLDGLPLWLLIVSGAGNTKTETVISLAGAGARIESTIVSEAALLSGTPMGEVADDATGGLLVGLGRNGTLVLKDFTSILSMGSESRSALLAALREIYDGEWSRNIGSDGGKTLRWTGRLTIVGAVTTAWDTHHAATATMGDRWVLIRTDSTNQEDRTVVGLQALANTGREGIMRDELADAVYRVIAAAKRAEPPVLTDQEQRLLLGAADLTTRARTAVEQDFHRNPMFAHALEGTQRFVKQLGQLVRGAIAIGLAREEALALALRCATDSIPPRRLLLLNHLHACLVADDAIVLPEVPDGAFDFDVCVGGWRRVKAVATAIQQPHTTIDRELQNMLLLGLVEMRSIEVDSKSPWHYRLKVRLPWAYPL
jgi:hypothetical protein